MDEYQFWASLWRTVALLIVGCLAICMTQCSVTNIQIRQSIQAGADPILAACALSLSQTAQECTVAMLRKDAK